MALSIHSIPAMSAEVERIFSSSKLLNLDRRNRLGDDVICALECMNSWEKAGIVESNEVRKMEEMLRAMEIQPEKREIAGCKVLPTKVRACTHWSLPKRFGLREDDKCFWCEGTVSQTREHLFRPCRRWSDPQKVLWKAVWKVTGWNAGRCRHVQVSELFPWKSAIKRW